MRHDDLRLGPAASRLRGCHQMTADLSGLDLGQRIQQKVPDAVVDARPEWAEVRAESLVEVCTFLRDDPELDFQYLSSLTGVDRLDHFEVVYHLLSISRNQEVILKARCHDHENPEVPSVVPVWRGAHLQEREAFDLMGIRFRGHPDLRRVFLWEGFPGHPLRQDWLNVPGGQMAGRERFPGEPGGKLEGRG
ncbi:MAG: NADH-quinone oxidoreductase subunit C [Dehalococcoidia bacterium]|nr:MAG: NADH-quinone oxidoreductase subunit C [Dehalococcoidia bacterium]